MNERIKELAEQCWDRRLDGVHFDQEKFANLVAAHEREQILDLECPLGWVKVDDIRARGKK